MKHTHIIAAAVLMACTACHRHHSEAEQTVPTVDVAHVITDSVTVSASFPGYLAADRTVDIVGRVSGQLLAKHYEGGQKVREGQVLFTIEPTTYADRVSQAEATLATAQSTLDYAATHYEAVNKALKADAVSKIEVTQAKSAMEQAQAQVKSAAAALQSARQMLGYCTVRAPFDGIMSTNAFAVGSYIGGEGNPVTLAQIYKSDVMTVKFSIDDGQYLQLLKGIEAPGGLKLDSVPLQFSDTLPHRYTARVTFISPALNQNTGTLQMEAKVENPYGELKPGMYVSIDLPMSTVSRALLVKDSSIATDQLGKYIYVVNDSDRVVYTPIKTGELYHDSLRIVTSGLLPTDRYVTKALLKVRAGMPVKPNMTH